MRDINIQVNRHKNMFMWNSVKMVLEKDIPSDQADVGFLFELLTVLAEKMQEDSTKHYLLTLEFQQARAIWFCLKVCVDNGLLPNPNLELQALEIMTKLAEQLDKVSDLPIEEVSTSNNKDLMEDTDKSLNIILS